MADDDFISSDTSVEVTHKGWFSRIAEAFKGILIGLVLFVVSFPVLFWNEGEAVRAYRALSEGAAAVVEVPADAVDPANEGKLVHVSAMTAVDDVLRDVDFGVEAKALRLRREVQIYQWTEKKKTETKKRVGGGTTEVATYTYRKNWEKSVIDSSNFHEAAHVNRGRLDFAHHQQTAPRIAIGAFALSPSLGDALSNYTPLASSSVDFSKASDVVRKQWRVAGDWFYKGADPDHPQIGDQRVRFYVILPQEFSLYSQQSGTSFRPFVASNDRAIERIEPGRHAAKEMFEHAQSEASFFKWMVRLAGFLAMALGLFLIARPLVVIADVIPFLGNAVSFGAGFFALLMAAILSAITIGIAWIYYRPVLGVSLLVGAGVLTAWLFKRRRK